MLLHSLRAGERFVVAAHPPGAARPRRIVRSGRALAPRRRPADRVRPNEDAGVAHRKRRDVVVEVPLLAVLEQVLLDVGHVERADRAAVRSRRYAPMARMALGPAEVAADRHDQVLLLQRLDDTGSSPRSTGNSAVGRLRRATSRSDRRTSRRCRPRIRRARRASRSTGRTARTPRTRTRAAPDSSGVSVNPCVLVRRSTMRA